MDTVQLLPIVFEGRLSIERARVVLRLPLQMNAKLTLIYVKFYFYPKPFGFCVSRLF